jgi:uncharacterized protein YgbK (DUF1537 family)
MKLFILADDLTGAADCAARCHSAGLAATVYLQRPPVTTSAGAICCTSDSRHLDADLAAWRVRELGAGLGETASAAWYKKIDSTLRGHIGQELDALLDALGRDCAVVCPAFPGQRRGLDEGYLTPAPAQPQHLPTLLARQSRRAVAAVGLADVRTGADRLAERLRAERSGAELLVVDALTDADLEVVLAASLRALPGALLCGSAGLAGVLASHYAQQAPRRGSSRPIAAGGGPALLVVGSGSAMAHSQIAYLRSHQVVTVCQPGGEAPVERAGDILLHLPEPPPGAELDGAQARHLAARLAEAALVIVDSVRPALLVVAGGDTAISLLGRMGVDELVVQRELLPGVPLMSGQDAAGRTHPIVLKAGNHGDEAALATLLARARMQQ